MPKLEFTAYVGKVSTQKEGAITFAEAHIEVANNHCDVTAPLLKAIDGDLQQLDFVIASDDEAMDLFKKQQLRTPVKITIEL